MNEPVELPDIGGGRSIYSKWLDAALHAGGVLGASETL